LFLKRKCMANNNGGASIIAWIALIVAVVGGILAWMAYSRTGGDIARQTDEMAQEEIQNFNEFAQESRLRIGRLEVNANFDQARDSLSQEEYGDALANLNEAKADLLQAYEGVDIEMNEGLRVVENQFNKLEQQIRGRNRDAALQTLEDLRNAINEQIDQSRGRQQQE
jgi:hypothetical protein